MLSKEQLSNPKTTLFLLIAITFFSLVFYSQMYESWSNDFLENLFYLFYFNIAIYLMAGIVVKERPFKLGFFFAAGFGLIFLAIYALFFLYASVLAHGFHN